MEQQKGRDEKEKVRREDLGRLGQAKVKRGEKGEKTTRDKWRRKGWIKQARNELMGEKGEEKGGKGEHG